MAGFGFAWGGGFRYNKTMSNVTAPKSALITGGAKRIGKAIALHLAEQGYHIAIHYSRSETEARSTVAELETFGVKAIALQADFAHPFDAAALLTQAHSAIGPIGCLINSASVFRKDTLTDSSKAAQHEHMQVNAFAPLALIQAYAALQPAAGNVINITDGASGWSDSSKYLSYALSKRTLAQYADLLARDLAPAIRINNLALGPVLPADDGYDDAMFPRLATRTPLQRLATLGEVLSSVNYLLATHSITGQTILLNGGMQCSELLTINL